MAMLRLMVKWSFGRGRKLRNGDIVGKFIMNNIKSFNKKYCDIIYMGSLSKAIVSTGNKRCIKIKPE